MRVLGPDFDFFDIDPDDNAQLKAAAELAQASRRLLESLGQNENAASRGLVRGLPSSLVAKAQADWLVDEASEDTPVTQPGVWFADNASLSIRYQPTGHADSVLTAWLEAIVAEPDSALRAALLDGFTGPGAPGRCTTCHSIERAASPSAATAGSSSSANTLTINWHALDRRQQPRGFTRFTHAPHLLPIELRDCNACHAINELADTSASYSGHNAASFVSDFHPVDKATCAACHKRTAVGEDCTQCHNYHVEGW
jgi:hypothetical protein